MLIQYLFFVGFILAMAFTLRRARQQVLSPRATVLWGLLWIGFGVVVLLPETSSVLARLFGVGRGVDLIIYFAILLLYYLVFRLFLRAQELEQKLTLLVRKESLNELKK